jgi:holin-like protein
MLRALTGLLLFQLAGEVLARWLGLAVPGPVIGMALLLGVLALRRGPGAELRGTAQTLLQHLSLLFVPAGTGVLVHTQRVAADWVPLTVALVLSTVIGLAVTALVLRRLVAPGAAARDRA